MYADSEALLTFVLLQIVALKGKMWTGLLNPLVAAQNFEYKMSKYV